MVPGEYNCFAALGVILVWGFVRIVTCRDHVQPMCSCVRPSDSFAASLVYFQAISCFWLLAVRSSLSRLRMGQVSQRAHVHLRISTLSIQAAVTAAVQFILHNLTDNRRRMDDMAA